MREEVSLTTFALNRPQKSTLKVFLSLPLPLYHSLSPYFSPLVPMLSSSIFGKDLLRSIFPLLRKKKKLFTFDVCLKVAATK